MEIDTFLGHDIAFWIELKTRVEENNLTASLEEIVMLRGKINFYESRIKQMAKLASDEIKGYV